jgi:hypothetical protein
LVALDNHAFSGPGRGLKLTLGPLVGAIAGLAVLLVLGAIVARGFSENGFRLASQLAWRYASFAFVAALAMGPLCRITAYFFSAFTPPDSLSRKLVWGFCAAYGVYLLSVFVPNVIHLSAGAMLMTVFGSSVVLVMAVTAAPLVRLGGPPILPDKVRKVLLGTSAAYFWLCYSLMALARISGPHRPDAFYGTSLSLMIVALLLRYADRWLAHRNGVTVPA